MKTNSTTMNYDNRCLYYFTHIYTVESLERYFNPVSYHFIKCIFIRCTNFQLMQVEKIGNSTLGYLLPEPLRKWRIYFPLFWLGVDTSSLHPWLVKPYNRRQLTMEERVTNYRIYRGSRVVKNLIENLTIRFRILLATMKQMPRLVRDIALTYVVLHNMLMTHQNGVGRAPKLKNLKLKKSFQIFKTF